MHYKKAPTPRLSSSAAENPTAGLFAVVVDTGSMFPSTLFFVLSLGAGERMSLVSLFAEGAIALARSARFN